MAVEPREPDLPRTAKVRTGVLRTGWTTGACAAAAAKAAALLLVRGEAVQEVEITLPQPFQGADRVRFAVDGTGWVGAAAHAVVVKDAGDDPDVTHGARVTATVELTGEPGVVLAAGEGVGTVTKPGLGLAVGGPAINPVPRAMITAALREVTEAGVRCTISVPGGERMARKTTNARLGVLGGISILGTTGVVRPFSTASWRASVEQAVDVMAAQGERMVVLATGGRTERVARGLLPHLPELCVVEVGDFTGAAVRRAVERGLDRVAFVGMAGKLAKLACGILMTHYTRSKVDLDLLAQITEEAGGGPVLVERVRAANTGRHAAEQWREAGLDAAPALLCDRVADVIVRFSGDRLQAQAAMVDLDSLEVVATSRTWGPE